MNKMTWLFTSALVALTPSLAHAYEEEVCCRPEPHWYGSINAGVAMLDDVKFSHSQFTTGTSPDTQTFKPGVRFGGAVGYRVLSPVRVELEGSYRTNDVEEDPGATIIGGTAGKKGHEPNKAYSVMSNVYYDFINRTNYTPYVGAGIGMTQVLTTRSYSGSGKLSDTLMSYQLMAGLAYRFIGGSRPVDGYMGYRYITGEDASTHVTTKPGKITFPNDSQSIEAGVRVWFN